MQWIMAYRQYVCQQIKKHPQNLGQKILQPDVLEICLDHSQKPVLMPVTPDMDLHAFLQDCRRVSFQSRGYEFLDDPGGDKQLQPF